MSHPDARPILVGMNASDQLVTLSPAAAARVRAIAERQAKPPRLRLAVDGGGCSGFTYRFGLAGDDADEQSRFIEAEVFGLRIAGIYLPNGNPQPGPKFDYKLRWMERLRDRAAAMLAEEVPAIIAGDFNVIPNDDDVFRPEAMADDALMQPESRAAYRRLLGDGWTDALRCQHPGGGIWTYWDYQAGAWQRDAGFRIDHLLLSPQAADRLTGACVDRTHRGREKASDHAPTWVELS